MEKVWGWVERAAWVAMIGTAVGINMEILGLLDFLSAEALFYIAVLVFATVSMCVNEHLRRRIDRTEKDWAAFKRSKAARYIAAEMTAKHDRPRH